MEGFRQKRLRQALFRGDALTLKNPLYLQWVRTFTEELLRSDLEPGDLTTHALRLEPGKRGKARVVAAAPGVLAGLDEVCWFYANHGVHVERLQADGESLHPGDEVLSAEGDQKTFLAVERVGLNLLQRMSGIATLTRRLQEQAHRHSPGTFVVATRKTPWGLLDKRAVHHGGGGTHRLGLWDGILIKTNHLRLIGGAEEEAIPLALGRAWPFRDRAVFVEVEVRGFNGALVAARAFRKLQQEEADPLPCLLMLDNIGPEETSRILAALWEEGLYEHVLIEASGQISEATVEAYAACGVDAISIGALTHSPPALDLRQRLADAE